MWPALILLVELLLIYTAGSRVSSRILGWGLRGGGWKRITAWILLAPGTAVHETSHLILVLLLGGRVARFAPFSPQMEADGRVQLGVVEHTPVWGGPLGGALVGMAPLFGVPVAIWVSGMALPGGGGTPWHTLAAASHTPWGILWIGVCMIVSLGALPSPSDHRDLPWALLILAPVVTGLALLGWLPNLEDLQPLLVWLCGLFVVPALIGMLGWVWPSHGRRY